MDGRCGHPFPFDPFRSGQFYGFYISINTALFLREITPFFNPSYVDFTALLTKPSSVWPRFAFRFP